MRAAELRDDYREEKPLTADKRRKYRNWVLVGVAALTVVSFTVSHFREQARSEAMAHWAAANGFTFQPHGDDAEGMMSSLHFMSGRNHYHFSNVSRGQVRGMDVVVFDWVVSMPSGRSTYSHAQTTMLLRTRQAAPNFGLWTVRYGATLGPDDIYLADYEHWPTMKYVLRPTGSDWRRPDRTQAIRDFLRQHGQNTQWRVQYGDGWLMLCHWDGTLSADGMNDFLNDSLAFADVLKSAW